MADQINDSIEEMSVSSFSSDDELETISFPWGTELRYKDNSINENDWSSSDDSDNDNDDDKEITYHHEELSKFKNVNWYMARFHINDMDQESVSRHESRQICYYKEKLLKIRKELIDQELILRPVYKYIGYHLESIHTFYNKANQFLNQTSSYSLMFKFSRSHPTATQNRLANIVERVETILNNLLHSKSITDAQYMAMKINRSSVRMNYLYFVSETQKEGIPVQPIMVCNDGPTMGISRYLGRLLGLLFNDATYCKKFHKAYNVIHAMDFYQKSGQLRPTTLFASFNINDLCLNFSHEQVITALEHFLNSYISSDYTIQGMTISTILQLVRLVLDEQYFIYKYKFYRQTAGSASGSSLTIPLVYIYLYYWQPDLLQDLINKNELFFRYQDEAFITWNRSEDELRTILAMANSQFPQPMWNITHIGSTIHFRDIELTNNNGVLKTCVYHQEMFDDNKLLSSFPDIIQPSIKQEPWKWLRTAILKAIRYSSDNNTLQEEMLEIKWQLELYQIPNSVFDQAYSEILEDFGVPIAYPRHTRSSYDIMRQHVFNYDQYRKAYKKEKQQQQQHKQQPQIILGLPYNTDLDGSTIDKIETELNSNLYQYVGHRPRIEHFSIKILRHPSPFLNFIDFLVKRRPSVDYLTLVDYEKNK
ncbi:unnamed protein product [Rotaria sordida]|uniref:Reverse transcriptase domain-containing protein n=1 Tax=Rotaria sordida TaxID=392033 RepID=A0A814ZP92_9BILA|nr:unnamed protein product [Rotaria sordida]